MNLKQMNDEGLLNKTDVLVREERELLTSILHHLREIERRRLFSALGYKSLFDMAVRRFGYSEDQKTAAPRKRCVRPEPKAPSAAVTRAVWRRAGSCCEICGSSFALEIDHRVPRAKGGWNKATPSDRVLLLKNVLSNLSLEGANIRNGLRKPFRILT